jgi:hypothetical protein
MAAATAGLASEPTKPACVRAAEPLGLRRLRDASSFLAGLRGGLRDLLGEHDAALDVGHGNGVAGVERPRTVDVDRGDGDVDAVLGALRLAQLLGRAGMGAVMSGCPLG